MLETKRLPQGLEMEAVNCDLCGSSNYSLWDTSRSNLVTKCNDCGLVFTNPRIARSEDKDRYLYTESYFSQKSRMTQNLVKARQTSYRMEISALEEFVDGGEILDVGCGMGLFLDCFDKKWERHGCDVSSYGLEEAGRRGINTYHGEFENIDFGERKFDVIYFRASLHHAYSPRRCIEKAVEMLVPNGMLVITMSNNCGGVCGRLFRAHIKSYEQAHNYLFSEVTLTKYMERSRMRVLKHHYPYFGTGYDSVGDFFKLPAVYAHYVILRLLGKLSDEKYWDLSSPPFYGNYVNVYARKDG